MPRDTENGEADFLRVLGERIRDGRARRGMARRVLARASGVSERYLAQLEAGQGNISIALLRRVARAMGMALTDLVREGPDPPVELGLLMETLSRLEPVELAAARALIERGFGPAEARGRNGRIALIGLRGAGKSTLGARLAQHLAIPFVELDRAVEHESGLSLAELFDLYGQGAYRRWERRALERTLAAHDRAVIAAGGSIVSEPATFALLLASCFTVWLQAAPEEHMSRVMAQGDRRPVEASAEAMDDLRRILAGRDALYRKADVSVDTAGRSIDESFRALAQAVGAEGDER
jgi:XRE family transcriptional regulator, aerobic/anaerobic benzoate catabolism transcriptional regulator